MGLSTRREAEQTVALMLDEDDYWREELIKEKKRRQHRFWVRDWIARRNNEEVNTIFNLQKEWEVSQLVMLLLIGPRCYLHPDWSLAGATQTTIGAKS